MSGNGTYRLKSAILRQYKLIDGCQDCGFDEDADRLEFDHVSGIKFDSVAHMASKDFSLERIAEEVAKCDVVCKPCHRDRTKQRKNNVVEQVIVSKEKVSSFVAMVNRYKGTSGS